jgi:glycosyltransferase 2 family protein
MKSTWYLALRIVLPIIGLGLVWYAFLRHQLFLSKPAIDTLVLGFALILLSNILVGVRLSILLKTQKIILPLQRAITIHFQTTFFAFFIPTSVGLEVTRFVKIKNYFNSVKKSLLVITLVLDRILGLIAVLCLILGLFFVSDLEYQMVQVEDMWIILLILFAMTVAGVVLVALLYHFQKQRIEKFFAAMRNTKFNIQTVVLLIILSFLIIILYGLGIYYFLISFNLAFPLLEVLFVFSSAVLFSVIPVSLLGVTASELSAPVFFALIGATTEEGMLFASLLFGSRILVALVGGGLELAQGGVRFYRMDKSPSPFVRQID